MVTPVGGFIAGKAVRKLGREEFLTFIPINFDEIGETFTSMGHSVFGKTEGILNTLGLQLVPKLAANTPLGATGRLARSTFHRTRQIPDETGKPTWILEVLQDATHHQAVSRRFFYGTIVSTGRLLGRMPPYQDLIPWVMHTWGTPVELSPRVAFALARHIAREGTESNDFYQRTILENKNLFQRAANNLGMEIVVAINAVPEVRITTNTEVRSFRRKARRQ